MDENDFYFGFESEENDKEKDKDKVTVESTEEKNEVISETPGSEEEGSPKQEQPEKKHAPTNEEPDNQAQIPSYYNIYRNGSYNSTPGSGNRRNSFLGPLIAFMTMLLVIGSVFGLNKLLSNKVANPEETTADAAVAQNETENATDKDKAAKEPTSVLTRSDINTTKNVSATVLDVSAIVEEVMPSVVAVTNKTIYTTSFSRYFGSGEQEMSGAGSGVIIGKNDDELLIVSNAHVVTPENYYNANITSNQITVTFVNEKEIEAYIKGTDEERDLAVIAVKLEDIDEETMKAIKIALVGDSNELKVGNGVIAIGNAMGYGQCMTVGYISALNREVTFSDGYTRSFLQTDAAINPGNSGGGLFNMDGNLVGINSAKLSDETVEGIGYAIPITDAEEVINDLMNRSTRTKVTDENKRASLGIKCSSRYQSVYEGNGAFVEEVVEDGAAAKAGIMAYDIITGIGDVKISSWTELLNEMAYHEAGEKITVKYMTLDVSGGRRSYEERETEVTLGYYKDMEKSTEKEDK